MKYQPFFEEIAKATADRAGDTVRVTAFVYAIKTYLPAVPSGPHFYDFVIGRPVSYIDADDAARILREELDWLFASRWTEYHAVARSLVPCTPEHVAVQDLGGVWWRVAAEPSFEVFLDGNRRFAVADRGQSEPVRTRGVSVDLADALQTLRWR